jgi:hypothetical protein
MAAFRAARRADHARFTGVSTPAGVNPKRPRCRRSEVYTLHAAKTEEAGLISAFDARERRQRSPGGQPPNG